MTKTRNLSGNTQNKPFIIYGKNWVEINDDARGTHNTNSQVKNKTTMLKTTLCD